MESVSEHADKGRHNRKRRDSATTVYLMIHQKTGLFYVGRTSHLKNRLWHHRNDPYGEILRRFGKTEASEWHVVPLVEAELGLTTFLEKYLIQRLQPPLNCEYTKRRYYFRTRYYREVTLGKASN
jgi:excinuclease UvrABC nuclease subunit